MLYQARRIGWMQNALISFGAVVALEVMLFASMSLPWPLSAAPVGGIILVIFFLFCLIRTELMLVGLFFLGISTESFPVYAQDVGSLYLSEVLIPIILVAYILQVLVRRRAVFFDKATMLPLLLLVVGSVLSLVYGNLYWNPRVPTNHRFLIVQVVTIIFIIYPAATYLLFSNCFDTRRHLKWLIPVLIVLPAMVNLFFLTSLALGQTNYIWVLHNEFQGANMASLLPPWALPLASWQSLEDIVTPMAFSALVFTTNKRVRLFLWAPFVLDVVAGLASLKAGYIGGLFATMVILSWFRSKKLFVGMLALFGLLLVAQPIFTEQSYLGTFAANAEKKRSGDRFILWGDAMRIWSTSPVLGVGPGNYYSYSFAYTSFEDLIAAQSRAARRSVNSYGQAHNGFLMILGELGVVGLAFWMWFAVAALLRLIRAASLVRDGPEKVFTIGVLGAFIFGLIRMLGWGGMYYSATMLGYVTFVVGMYTFALLGMVVGMSRREEIAGRLAGQPRWPAARGWR